MQGLTQTREFWVPSLEWLSAHGGDLNARHNQENALWAPWCAPCPAVAPVLVQIARGRAGQVLVLKVNTDEHPEPSARLGIRGIPTLIAFKDEREVARQVGALPAPS